MFKITKSFFKKIFLISSVAFFSIFSWFSSNKQNVEAKIDTHGIISSLRNTLGLKARNSSKKLKSRVSGDFKKKEENKIELLHYRTENSKTYQIDDSNFQLLATIDPLHYKDELGQWQDIDLNIKNNAVVKAGYNAHLLENNFGYKIKHNDDKLGFVVTLATIGGVTPKYFAPQIEANKAIWNNIVPGVDLSIEFLSKRVSIWRKINDKNSPHEVVWNVEEDKGEKRIKIVKKILGYDQDRQPLETIRQKKDLSQTDQIKQYQFRDTFTGKVIKVAKDTRRKYVSPDVLYPVMIDADIQIAVSQQTGGANAGTAVRWSDSVGSPDIWTATTSLDYTVANTLNRLGLDVYAKKGSPDPYPCCAFRRDGWVRFLGITLPKSTVITSASLELHTLNTEGGAAGTSVQIQGTKLDNPAVPPNASNVMVPVNPIGTATKTITGSSSYEAWDVKTLVSTLVSNFNYTNDQMLFFTRFKNIIPTHTVPTDRIWNVYLSGSGVGPKLTINYTGRLNGARIMAVE